MSLKEPSDQIVIRLNEDSTIYPIEAFIALYGLSRCRMMAWISDRQCKINQARAQPGGTNDDGISPCYHCSRATLKRARRRVIERERPDQMICTKCGVEYPYTEEHFYPRSDANALMRICKGCKRQRSRADGAKKREKRRALNEYSGVRPGHKDRLGGVSKRRG